MRKILIMLGIAVIIIVAIIIAVSNWSILWLNTAVCSQEAKLCPDGTAVGRTGANCEFVACPADSKPAEATSLKSLAWPLTDAMLRITKKPFGIKISRATSPVQPERFSGYHTGTDFETFTNEQNIDVPIKAICSGPLLMKKTATGYGCVAVEKCKIGEQVVTVVYGHLKIASVSATIGSEIKAGDQIGTLGKGYSAETDGERKHLHLGIHKGSSVNILGYVKTKSALSDWLDAAVYLK